MGAGPPLWPAGLVEGEEAALVVIPSLDDEPLIERERGTGVAVVPIARPAGDFVVVVQVEVPEFAPVGGIPTVQMAVGAESVEQVCLGVIFRG